MAHYVTLAQLTSAQQLVVTFAHVTHADNLQANMVVLKQTNADVG